MPSINLRRAKPVVQAFCEERGIRYTETTLVGSCRIVLRYLQRVGLKHADPFEGPVTAQFLHAARPAGEPRAYRVRMPGRRREAWTRVAAIVVGVALVAVATPSTRRSTAAT